MPIQTEILTDGIFQLAVEFEWQIDDDPIIYGAWPARLPKVLRVKDYDICTFFNEGELEAKLEDHFEQKAKDWRLAA
jgi:hypothetical protein